MCEAEYQCDGEFLKLLAHRADIDLARAVLELARDADPELDFRPTLDWIAERGRELSKPVAHARNDHEALETLRHCLAEIYDLCGDASCYTCPEGSYLNRIIETRRGIPIALSVLYLLVGAKVGISLSGVAAPMHFLLRYEGIDGPVFVDPYSRGQILSRKECLLWLQDQTGIQRGSLGKSLRPVGNRQIIIRMLSNLKSMHLKQENWRQAWLVQHRLTALHPSCYDHQRDLALISLKANQPGQALDLLERCLKLCPQEEQDLLQHSRGMARRLLSLWN